MDRPTWDEYYMGIARAVSTRSNCIRRSVGAVIIVQNAIIGTGYNGTPVGVRNCCDGGCPRCASDAAPGEGLIEHVASFDLTDYARDDLDDVFPFSTTGQSRWARYQSNLQLTAEVFNLLDDGTYQIYNPFVERGIQINGRNEAQQRFGRRWQVGMKLAF